MQEKLQNGRMIGYVLGIAVFVAVVAGSFWSTKARIVARELLRSPDWRCLYRLLRSC